MRVFVKILCLALTFVTCAMLLFSCNTKTDDGQVRETTDTIEESASVVETEEAKEETVMQKIVKRMKEDDNYLIISLGDSITEGQGATNANTSYTAVFAKGLAGRIAGKTITRLDGKRDGDHLGVYNKTVLKKGDQGKITVVRSGYGGNTVKRIINRKDDYIGRTFEEADVADLFIISVGINDSIVDDPAKYISPKGFKINLGKLVDMIREAHPGVDIILLTPTWCDRGTEKKSIVDAHAKAMIEFATEENIPYIDMHKMWMEHLVIGEKNFGQGDWLVDGGDHCHPSDVGHAVMAEEILKFIFEEDNATSES